MYTNRVVGTAKCVLFIEVSSFLNKGFHCTNTDHTLYTQTLEKYKADIQIKSQGNNLSKKNCCLRWDDACMHASSCISHACMTYVFLFLAATADGAVFEIIPGVDGQEGLIRAALK